MGSSASSTNRKSDLSTSPEVPVMSMPLTQQTVVTSSKAVGTSCGPKPLKGILKNKKAVIEEKPVKIVEIYVLKGSEWKVTRVREDEVEKRKKELKSDKSVKRVYTKPTQDQTFLHYQPF